MPCWWPCFFAQKLLKAQAKQPVDDAAKAASTPKRKDAKDASDDVKASTPKRKDAAKDAIADDIPKTSTPKRKDPTKDAVKDAAKDADDKASTPKRKDAPILLISPPSFDDATARRIFNGIRDHKDKDGELLSDMFMKLPSKKEYPDYYQVIPEPMDLVTIEVLFWFFYGFF